MQWLHVYKTSHWLRTNTGIVYLSNIDQGYFFIGEIFVYNFAQNLWNNLDEFTVKVILLINLL